MSDPHIHILLASYNGERHLQAQLDSIAAQTWQGWRLLVSDDGSTDTTRQIIAAFAKTQAAGQVQMVEGPRAGATANFLHLIATAPGGVTLAFCDQDDVWKADKLQRAVDAIPTDADSPIHYSARTIIADAALNPLTESPRFTRKFGLRNALVQACTAGNTSVFNPAAARILKQGAAAARQAGIVSHDWWAYQLIAAAGGKIVKDDSPVLFYRQHSENEMGRNDTLRARLHRLSLLFQGDYGKWLAANQRALAAVPQLLTNDSRRMIDSFGDAFGQSGLQAAMTFRRLGLYRHDLPGTAALYGAAASGRLRKNPPDGQASRRAR